MAQRAIIGINGELSPFDESLAKLRTPGIGGDSITWVPHNDTLCAALTVRANGTYNAADKGVYGFDYVAVSVPGESVTGKDPTTGQEVVVSKDPDTGEIVETVVPTEIRVITPPTFTGPYGDGAYIDFTGLTVAAYDAKGNKMQDVPFSELVFPVTVTEYKPDAPINSYIAKSDLDVGTPDGVRCGNEIIYYGIENRDNIDSKKEHRTTIYRRDYLAGDIKRSSIIETITVNDRRALRYNVFLASAKPGKYNNYIHQIRTWADTGVIAQDLYDVQTVNLSGTNSYTHDGKTVYYSVGQAAFYNIDVYEAGIEPVANTQGQTELIPLMAWTMIYGDLTSAGGGTQIPVQWPRLGDGAILETSFAVSVWDVAPSGS